MRRSELSPDLMLWTIPARRMKAGREHVLPLPPGAREIIKGALAETKGAIVFPNRSGTTITATVMSRSMKKLQLKLKFKDADGEEDPAKMHDLRRTMATGFQSLGVPTEVGKAALAHSDKGDVHGTHYAQSDLCREVREALVRWQAAVTQMVRGQDPFAFRSEDALEMERRLLGQDQVVAATQVLPDNVLPMQARKTA